MQISIQDAYAEAFQVIGEQIVERRLLSRKAEETATSKATTDPEGQTQDAIAEPNREVGGETHG